MHALGPTMTDGAIQDTQTKYPLGIVGPGLVVDTSRPRRPRARVSLEDRHETSRKRPRLRRSRRQRLERVGTFPHQTSRLRPGGHGARTGGRQRDAGERLEDHAGGPATRVGRHDSQRTGQSRRQALRVHQHRLHASRACTSSISRRRRRSRRSRWSRRGAGWPSRRTASASSCRAAPAIPDSDIQYFDRWDNGGWKESRVRLHAAGAAKDKTAVSWLGVSADGTLLYALNNSDDSLYILETHGGRAVAPRQGRRSSAVRASSRRTARRCTSRISAAPACRSSTSAIPAQPAVAATLATDPHPNDIVAHRGRPPVRVLRQHQQRDLVRSEDAAAPRSDQHRARSESAGRQHAELARAVARRRDALRRQRRQQLGGGRSTSRSAARASPLGFLPTGWYPTFVTTSPDGKRIIVASSKGNGTGPSRVKRPIDPIAPAAELPASRQPAERPACRSSTRPTRRRSPALTKQVYDNALYRDALLETSGAGAEHGDSRRRSASRRRSRTCSSS